MTQRQTRTRTSEPKETESAEPTPSRLHKETRHGIWAIALFTIAALTLLSFFDLAGTLGRVIDDGLTIVFGWGHFVVPIVLISIGYILLIPERARFSMTTGLGLLLLVLSYSGLLHLFVPLDEALTTVESGYGGGYAGVVLSYPLQKLMGLWATLIVLFALVVISFLVVFNTTLQQIADRGSALVRLSDWFRDLWERIRFGIRRPSSGDEHDMADEEEEDDASFSQRQISEDEVLTTEAGVDDGTGQMAMLPKPKRRTVRAVKLDTKLLDVNQSKPTSGNIDENKEIIKRTLGNFGINVEMDEVNVGPTVTQYTLKPAEGVKLAQIMTLQNDLALALAAHPIRIEAPIPGKSLVGIEVPNQSVAIVSLREVLESDEFKKSPDPLVFGLGKDVAGKPWVADLDPLPHLLIAGATGSGKSVGINNLIVSLLFRNSPDQLKFIMVDPKRVELSVYNDIPHLLTPVITTVDKTINALKWVVAEMDRRYQVLQEAGKRDIHSYRRDVNDNMPFIVVVIDELADLMTVAAKAVEGAIIRLAQMARAVGIHLVVATQRPSVDVITGLIKANITARVAYNVVSIVDSRTILDTGGAEKLLGRGDMLFISSNMSKPKRIQGAYLSDKEIERVVKALKQAGTPEYTEEVTAKAVPKPTGSVDDMEEDELLGEAQRVIVQAGKASASLLQRRLRVGYARAARLLDLLEERGIIGPGDGAKPREILATSDTTEPFADTADDTTEDDTDEVDAVDDGEEMIEEDDEQTEDDADDSERV